MKKLIAIVLLIAIAVLLTGCFKQVGQEIAVEEQVEEQSVVDDIEDDTAAIDDIEADIDLSELDSLEEDLDALI